MPGVQNNGILARRVLTMSINYFPELDARMQEGFMAKLVALREQVGFPMPVTSGYRSPEDNAAISSTGTNGPHTTGRAVDISISGENAYKLIAAALAAGFTGIGIKQHGPLVGRYVHLDDLTSPEYPRPRIWTYK